MQRRLQHDCDYENEKFAEKDRMFMKKGRYFSCQNYQNSNVCENVEGFLDPLRSF